MRKVSESRAEARGPNSAMPRPFVLTHEYSTLPSIMRCRASAGTVWSLLLCLFDTTAELICNLYLSVAAKKKKKKKKKVGALRVVLALVLRRIAVVGTMFRRWCGSRGFAGRTGLQTRMRTAARWP